MHTTKVETVALGMQPVIELEVLTNANFNPSCQELT